MKRTVLIANTSDMPVAAREASVYTGITIAEYFRDMGYDVAVIADSTSRWAEALREMTGRLEEMPGEEGYPAYLASRLAQFYERAGVVECVGSEERRGSLTAVGAVSPPGGDLSEPVSQGTMRIVKVFWSLDSSLAYRRHFPAINWLNSYSLYLDTMKPWFDEHFGPAFMENRAPGHEPSSRRRPSLNEIVQLVGKDALSAGDQLTLEVAKMVREDFLQQNAFMDVDSYSSFDRQMRLLALILDYDTLARAAVDKGADLQALLTISAREEIGRAKFVEAEQYAAEYAAIREKMEGRSPRSRRKAVRTHDEGIPDHPRGLRPPDGGGEGGGRHLRRAGRDRTERRQRPPLPGAGGGRGHRRGAAFREQRRHQPAGLQGPLSGPPPAAGRQRRHAGPGVQRHGPAHRRRPGDPARGSTGTSTACP